MGSVPPPPGSGSNQERQVGSTNIYLKIDIKLKFFEASMKICHSEALENPGENDERPKTIIKKTTELCHTNGR